MDSNRWYDQFFMHSNRIQIDDEWRVNQSQNYHEIFMNHMNLIYLCSTALRHSKLIHFKNKIRKNCLCRHIQNRNRLPQTVGSHMPIEWLSIWRTDSPKQHWNGYRMCSHSFQSIHFIQQRPYVGHALAQCTDKIDWKLYCLFLIEIITCRMYKKRLNNRLQTEESALAARIV